MKLLVIIVISLAAVVGLTNSASTHSFHHNTQLEGRLPSLPLTDENDGVKPQPTKRNSKDAFYGNAKTQAERDVIDSAHKTRLASKSSNRFMANLQLAIQDILNRLRSK